MRVLTMVLLLWVWLPSVALVVPDLYAADVPVSDDSAGSLNKALPDALTQVLIKVSGNTAIATVPSIQTVLGQANHWVDSYSYASSPPPNSLTLHVNFDPKAVHQLLRQSEQTIWRDDRPLTLVWLQVPEASHMQVLGSEDPSPLLTLMRKTAAERGVPVIFPAMDLEDQALHLDTMSVLPADNPLQSLSVRYGVTSILAGRVWLDSDNQWQGEWRLVLNNTPYAWQTTGEDASQVVSHGLARATDMMVNQLASLTSKAMQSAVMLQITGIANIDDYANAIAALKQLAPVTGVVVSDMNTDTVLLKVNTSGGADALADALKNTTQFAAETKANNNADLFYHFQSTTPTPVPLSSGAAT